MTLDNYNNILYENVFFPKYLHIAHVIGDFNYSCAQLNSIAMPGSDHFFFYDIFEFQSDGVRLAARRYKNNFSNGFDILLPKQDLIGDYELIKNSIHIVENLICISNDKIFWNTLLRERADGL